MRYFSKFVYLKIDSEKIKQSIINVIKYSVDVFYLITDINN